jgi:hypothetical protein
MPLNNGCAASSSGAIYIVLEASSLDLNVYEYGLCLVTSVQLRFIYSR